jgi:hypothetical protein
MSYTAITENCEGKISYRCRSCDTNLTSNTPADQFQRLKLIQNTVRVASSLYTMNLAGLNAYQKPIIYGVPWNQMSDRAAPAVQKTYVPTKGGIVGSNSVRHTVTASRPGAQSPGGIGCDIKHNSYARYLNRIKGRSPLRQGVVPPAFGAPIPFNRAFPIYGGKTIKTNIVTGCKCPPDSSDAALYYAPPYPYPSVRCIFSVGEYVYAVNDSTPHRLIQKAVIIESLGDEKFLIKFEEDGTTEEKRCDELMIYYPCNCVNTATNDYVEKYEDLCYV